MITHGTVLDRGYYDGMSMSDATGGRFYDLWVKDEFTTGAWYGEPATMYAEGNEA